MTINAIDIICEACSARMRLSPTLLSQITGRAGRVTCKKCEKKVGLDATGEELRITYGGRRAELDDDQEPISTTDPHLSEFPPGMKVALPPPLSDELKERRRLRALAADNQTLPEAADLLSASAAPAPQAELVEADEEPPTQRRGLTLDAPPPHLERGSLSPHTLEDSHEEELIPMGRSLPSTPYVSERDKTFNSLFPDAKPDLEGPESERVTSPYVRRGPLDADSAPTPAPREESSSRSRGAAWLPWGIAAVALFALGVSLSFQLSDSGVLSASQKDSAPRLMASRAPLEADSLPAAPELLLATSVDEVEEDVEDPNAQSALEKERQAFRDEPREVVSPSELQPSGTRSPSSDKASSAGVPVTEPQKAVVAPEPEKPEETGPGPFSTAAASAALREATTLASACRGDDDPSGIAKIQVTFAPSGKVTNAMVSGPPFAGTKTGSCIASRFRSAAVPEFTGDFVTVMKTVTIR